MLELDSLTLAYGPRVVLRAVSFRVEPGEVVGLIGPNGSGKSTLIRAASGVLAPLRGTVRARGKDLARLRPAERAREVAVVPQAVQLPEAFTVFDTVLLGRTPHLGWLGWEGERDRQGVREALRRASVADLEDRRLGDLSGGERQLVLIARALAQDTPILLLDEPTAHLDLRHQSRILELVRRLARADRRAVLMALHDLNLAAEFADRVALLSDGTLGALGPPARVLTPATLEAAYGIPVAVFPRPGRGTPVVLPEVE